MSVCAMSAAGRLGGWLAASALVVGLAGQGCADDGPTKPVRNEAGQLLEAGPADSHPRDRGPVTCSVDFPCFGKQTRCNGATKYYNVQTVPCEKYCGDANCSGASCDPVGPEMTCPPGTICEDKGKADPCVGVDAGVDDGGGDGSASDA